MKLQVLAVGRLKSGWAEEACQDYLKRIRRSLPLELKEVRDVDRRRGRSPQWKAAEAQSLERAASSSALWIALDERGREWSSREFAVWLQGEREKGTRELSFILGGPDGLDPSFRERCHRSWSLGRLTLPHELARVLLCEQIYRGLSIIAGSPYHRD